LTISCSAKFVDFYHSTRRHEPEDITTFPQTLNFASDFERVSKNYEKKTTISFLVYVCPLKQLCSQLTNFREIS